MLRKSRSFFKINILRYSKIKTLKLLARRGVKFRKTDIFNCYQCLKIKPHQKQTFFPRIYFQGKASQEVTNEFLCISNKKTQKIYINKNIFSTACKAKSIQEEEGLQDKNIQFYNLKNKIIADFCASPGSKTTSLLVCKPEKLYCFEKNRSRFLILKEIVTQFGWNYTKKSVFFKNENAIFAHKNFRGFFDFILVDAPCSGIGTTKSSEKQSKINFLAELQLRLLKSAIWSLKNSGLVVYSVCTCTYKETEGVIEKLLAYFKKKNPDFEIKQTIKITITEEDERFFVCHLIKAPKT